MEDKIKKSLRYSLFDGMFASAMLGISEIFIAPYALAMKAGASLIGILLSLPNFAGALSQLRSAWLVERLGSRKALINTAALLQALMWLPIISIPYIFHSHRAVVLVVFYTFFVVLGSIMFPAWSSLMADHVRETERGKVFGWRNRLFGFINVLCMFAAGSILYIATRIASGNGSGGISTFAISGFTIIFAIAFVARLISWRFLTKMYEPVIIISEEHRFTFFDFLKRIRKSNFGRFVIFVASMNFCVFLASPFFGVYMLKDLRFDYFTYTIVTLAATLTSLCMMYVWGRYADSVGNVKILKLTSLFVPFIPLFWMVSHNVIYLIVIQVFSGFFWAGFNLSVTNFIYDAVRPEKRTRCIAYFNVVNGVALFSGAAIGGYLLNIVPPIGGYRMLTLLLISGIARLAVSGLSSLVREVRSVRNISRLELFYSIIGLRPSLRQDLFLVSTKE